MIIKNLTLKDFRQYKGVQSINFDLENDRNVTVILGLNTSGKTTIVEAFKWCLYGETEYNIKDLINAETAKSLGVEEIVDTFVQIELIHGGQEYIIKRAREFKGSINEDYILLRKENFEIHIKNENGETTRVRDSERGSVINKILPQDLSDYFFFDGEGISNISNNRRDIKNAVQGLMELDILISLKERLDPNGPKTKSVTAMFKDELDLEAPSIKSNLLVDIESAKKRYEYEKKRLEEAQDSLDKYKKRERELSLRLMENKATKEKEEKKLRLEAQVKKLGYDIEETEKRLKYDFSHNSYNFFALPLIEDTLKVLESVDVETKVLPGIESIALEKIIERGQCICGTKLEEEHKSLLSITKNLIESNSLHPKINKYKNRYKSIEDEGYRFSKWIFKEYERYTRLYNDRADLEREIEILSEELRNTENVGKLEKDRREVQENINRVNNKIDEINRKIGLFEGEIEKLEKSRNSLIKATDENKKIKRCIAYSEALFEIFEEDYARAEKYVKDGLENNINKIFNKMYHGDRIIKIDDNYNVILKTKLGEEHIKTSESRGLEAVKNFSFVSGLVELARDKVYAKSLGLNNKEPYPLIMDAPFSNVDEVHIEKISKILPSVAEQVIIILMEKDWQHARKTLDEKVHTVYRINKLNEVHSELIKEG